MKHAHLFRQELETQKCDILSQSQNQDSKAAIAMTNAVISADKIQIQKAFQEQKEGNNWLNIQKIRLFYKEDYQSAKYSKSLQYKNLHSYLKKNTSGEFAIKMMDKTEQFKYFGLGIYFYIEFMRRMSWIFLVMSLLVIFTIVINWHGEGMNDYSSSFSTYLIKSTIGNYSRNRITSVDGYIITIVPAANFFALFIFYVILKGHFFIAKREEEKNSDAIKAQKFAIQITGLNQNFKNEGQLKKFFSSFGQIYQVSLVSRYSNKLSYFSELEELEQSIKQEQLQIILGSGSQTKLLALKQKKQQLTSMINSFEIQTKTISAFIHFQMENARNQCLTEFSNNYLFDNCTNNCMRSCCCCCLQKPAQKFMFYDSPILIKKDKIPPAYDINWNSYQIGPCEKIFRFLLSFIVILIFLAISTTLIGMCSIYITSRSSNCQNLTIPSTLALAQATTDSKLRQCYCDANLITTISNSQLNSFCGQYITDIYISQGIQYGIIFTTALINFLFSLLVSSLVNFVRPQSKSSKLFSETLIYTVFVILNSILVPLLVYADVYGFSANNYVSFLTIISSDIHNFLAVDNISFHTDFNAVWYKNVSVIFINFIILDTILVWILFAFEKYLARHSSLESQEGRILQKHMNKNIISYKLNVYKQMAGVYLILVMCLLFCSGVPILVPLTFINIFSRYIKNRNLIQNNSSQIEGLGEDFNTLSISILPIILILCPLIGQWMIVANKDIYPNQLNMALPILNGYFTQLDKQLYLPFYILISTLAFCQFFVYNIFVRFLGCLCDLCYKERDLRLSYNARPFSEYAKGINMLCSYNIRHNDEMKNIILTLEKYLIEQKSNRK